MSELAMTQIRLDMLQHVKDGKIVYDAGSGHWRMGDETVTGWVGRTLSALRRAGYIELGGDVGKVQENPMYTVDLTGAGREALA